MKTLLLLVFGFTVGSALSAAPSTHRCGIHHFPDSTAHAYPVDSIRTYFARFSGDTVNQYRIRPDQWWQGIKAARNFSTVLIFNEDGSNVQLKDPGRCSNTSMLLEHNLPSRIDRSRYLDNFVPMLEAISPATWQRNQFTAMIFWNRSLGALADDCPFEWARQLRFKYGNSIRIIWVNTDLSADADTQVRDDGLNRMNRYLSATMRELY